MTVIELSVPIETGLPCTWPGHTPFEAREHEVRSTVAVARSRTLCFDEHLGTHSDTVGHFIRPDAPVAEAPGLGVVGRARLIDVRDVCSDRAGISAQVEPDVLLAQEDRSGRFAADEVALVRTGWSDRHYGAGQAGLRYLSDPVSGVVPGWPVLSVAALLLLAQRGVTAIGIDAPSIGAVDDPAPQHLAALEHGLTPIENLTNLGEVVTLTEPMFVFLPLRLLGATGLPGRAVAIPRAWSDRRSE